MSRKAARRSWQIPWLPLAIGILLCVSFIGFVSLAAVVSQPGFDGHRVPSKLQQPRQLAKESVDGRSVSSFNAGATHLQADVGLPRAEGKSNNLLRLSRERSPERSPTTTNNNKIRWQKHVGKSCQGYANEDSRQRSLEESKIACLANEVCVAIECPTGQTTDCTLRASSKLVDYAVADCHEQLEETPDGKLLTARPHPAYDDLLREYPFQQVSNQAGQQVNIMLVRSHMNQHQKDLYQKYKDEILFIGISSMNDYPLGENSEKTEYCEMFPAFLHMMRNPEKCFPPSVKTLLMSQSDFNLPDYGERDYSKPRKYDFTYSGSDCDVWNDCKGWCGHSKNWSFVKQSLGLMCGELNLTGVLVATKDKSGKLACSIPPSCKGKMIQTSYIPDQNAYFEYLKNSRFAFLPQIHDASPRVSSQALALDVPILMNYYIQGGWKYVTAESGEYFHDMSDFREQLLKILKGADTKNGYQPRKWVLENYGNERSGKLLYDFVLKHFSHRIKLPKGTKRLQI